MFAPEEALERMSHGAQSEPYQGAAEVLPARLKGAILGQLGIGATRSDRPNCFPSPRVPYAIDGIAHGEKESSDFAVRLSQIADTVVHGQVVSVRPGWYLHDDVPAQLLEIRSASILRQIPYAPHEENESLWLIYPAGSVRVAERLYCAEHGPRPPLELGDMVLLTGWQLNVDPWQLLAVEVYEVVGGKVVPSPYSSVVAPSDLSIESVRERLSRKAIP